MVMLFSIYYFSKEESETFNIQNDTISESYSQEIPGVENRVKTVSMRENIEETRWSEWDYHSEVFFVSKIRGKKRNWWSLDKKISENLRSNIYKRLGKKRSRACPQPQKPRQRVKAKSWGLRTFLNKKWNKHMERGYWGGSSLSDPKSPRDPSSNLLGLRQLKRPFSWWYHRVLGGRKDSHSDGTA